MSYQEKQDFISKLKSKFSKQTESEVTHTTEKESVSTAYSSAELLLDKDYSILLQWIIYGCFALIIVLMFFVYHATSSRPSVATFAINSKGQISQQYSIATETKPLNRASVENFATKAVNQTFSYDFANYSFRLDSVIPNYFTQHAAKQLITKLDKYSADVIHNKYFVSANVTNVFSTEAGKDIQGKDASQWHVRVKATVMESDGHNSVVIPVNIQLAIISDSKMNNDYGLAVEGFAMTNQGGM